MNNMIKTKIVDIETQDIIMVRVTVVETDKRKKQDIMRYGIIYKDEFPTNPIAWTDEEGHRFDLVSEVLYSHLKIIILTAKNEIRRLNDKINNQDAIIDTYKTTFEALKSQGIV